MKNKKVLWIVLLIIAIVIIGIAIFWKTSKNNVSLDLKKVDEDISNEEPFSEIATLDLDKQAAASVFSINEENIEEVIGKFPMMNVHASMYVVIKCTKGKVDEVYNNIVEYGENYEEQWSMYLPEQYDLVLARKVGKIGDYVYMIVADSASELVSLIK